MKKSKIYCIAILFICFAMPAVSLGMSINAYGVFFTPVSEALGVGRGAVALHATLIAVVTGFASPFVVRLCGRIPLKWIVSVGILLVFASTYLMALADRVWQFNLLGIIKGLGCATMSLSIVTMLIGNWFRSNVSVITGIILSGSGVAGAIFSPVYTAMIAGMGYQNAYRLNALIMLVLVLPASLVFLHLKPEEAGLLPFGSDGERTIRKKQSENAVQPLRYRSLLFAGICLISFATIAVTGLTQHMTGFGETIGISASEGALLVTVIMVSNISSKFIMGFLCRLIGDIRANVLLTCVSLAGLLLLLFGGGNIFILSVGAFLFGTIYAVATVGISSMIRSVYGNEQYAKSYALPAALNYLGSASAITVIGYLYDFSGSYVSSLVTALIFLLVCAVLFIFILKKVSVGTKQFR